MHDDLKAAVRADMARIRSELEDMVKIPSVSAPGYDPAEVRRSAEFVADLLRESGLDQVQLLELERAHPAGERVEHPPDALRLAVEPFERDGRLFGRGVADDKAGIVMHLASIRAFGDDLPVTVKVFIEGEEEIGSVHLEAFVDTYAEMLASDAIVIGDLGNWREGTPTITTSLRGLVDCYVTVRTLESAVHSGTFGGIYPDAITSLARIIAKLHHDDGSVAIPGLVTDHADPLDSSEDELASQARPVPGCVPLGTGTLTSRMWRQPAVSVLAIDAVPINEAINQLVPEAHAKVSMRLAPGQDTEAAMRSLIDHLEASAPWGVDVEVRRGSSGDAFELDTSHPMFDAYRQGMVEGYGADVVEIGTGGSIPFVAAFNERYPDAPIFLVGVSDPTSSYHGPNESLSLKDMESAAMSQAIALRLLGS